MEFGYTTVTVIKKWPLHHRILILHSEVKKWVQIYFSALKNMTLQF